MIFCTLKDLQSCYQSLPGLFGLTEEWICNNQGVKLKTKLSFLSSKKHQFFQIDGFTVPKDFLNLLPMHLFNNQGKLYEP